MVGDVDSRLTTSLPPTGVFLPHKLLAKKIEFVMLCPIVDIKPFTSFPVSKCLVTGEGYQSAPIPSHQILSGRQTPAVTTLIYDISVVHTARTF